MNFVSVEFFGFFAIVYLLYWRIGTVERRKYLLIVASYVFYGVWDWRFSGLMLFVTANAYIAGRTMHLVTQRRLHVLWVSVGTDLAVLGFFKYYNFFVDSAASGLSTLGLPAPLPVLAIVLPVGISFYTFHAISYVVDVYRGKVRAESSLCNVALYIAFFPQLIAGPIVRASFFMPQLRRLPPYSAIGQGNGIRLFLRGLIYKAVIADNLAQICDPIFADLGRYSDQALITATIAFYGEIYFDFAGYSAMATGAARLLGYRIPKNFDYPYSSLSVTEFWRRWNMSLSFWLRDYVYIPLGGNRGARWALYRNLMATMVLGGLWHGASWNFVVWGALHGIGLCLHKLWLGYRPRISLGIDWDGPAWRMMALLLTQLWVFVAWVFFRCTDFSDAIQVLKAMTGLREVMGIEVQSSGVWILVIIAADHLLGRSKLRLGLANETVRHIYWVGVGALAAVAIMIMPLAQKAFIYFQF